MRADQYISIHDQLAPAMVDLFNKEGGMQPIMLWVKLTTADDLQLEAAGQVAEQGALTRLFKDGTAHSMMTLMVTDLLENSKLPPEMGEGRIDAVVVCGEVTVKSTGQEGASGSGEALCIWIHSATRTETAWHPISVDGAKRTCSLTSIELTATGRTGPMTMQPSAQVEQRSREAAVH